MRIHLELTPKRGLGLLAGLLVLVVLGALLVSFSGLVSIAASEGHWALTRWFLGWTMENAVRTQAMPVRPPEGLDLGDRMLVRRAAGHFATGCAACHGAPGQRQSPVVRQMVPQPPRLEVKVGEWSDEELFWIVKHGIKFSGMPAWPAQARDDEVWAQVAFLRALPGMSPQAYAQLALGGGLADDDTQAGGQGLASLNGVVQNALADCARCHGHDGLGRGQGAFPAIAGQPMEYLYATLLSFAQGRRQSGFMQPPAARYDPVVLRELARHFAGQPAPAATGAHASAPVPPAPAQYDRPGILEDGGAQATLGERIALLGLPEQKIPACASCHERAGRRKNPFYPYLDGQPAWYVAQHLKLWKQGERDGTAYSQLMAEIARQMTEEQIRAVAAWYAKRGSAARR